MSTLSGSFMLLVSVKGINIYLDDQVRNLNIIPSAFSLHHAMHTPSYHSQCNLFNVCLASPLTLTGALVELGCVQQICAKFGTLGMQNRMEQNTKMHRLISRAFLSRSGRAM